MPRNPRSSLLGARRARLARRRVRKYSKGKKSPMTTKIAKIVQRLITKKEETKYVANAPADNAGTDLGGLWYATPQLTTVGSYYPAMPVLTQGTDDYQRIGNKINPTSLAMSVKVGFNATDLSCNAIYGVIYYGTSKAGKTWQNDTPVTTAAILDDGQGAVQPWNASRYQLNLPIDRKYFSLKRIVFKLSKTTGVLNHENGTANQGNFATSSGQSDRNFLLRFKTPKQLLYAQGTHRFPQNYAPFWGIGFCHTDGSTITAADDNMVNVSSRCHMYYKDA